MMLSDADERGDNPEGARTLLLGDWALEQELGLSDVVIGAVHVPGERHTFGGCKHRGHWRQRSTRRDGFPLRQSIYSRVSPMCPFAT